MGLRVFKEVETPSFLQLTRKNAIRINIWLPKTQEFKVRLYCNPRPLIPYRRAGSQRCPALRERNRKVLDTTMKNTAIAYGLNSVDKYEAWGLIIRNRHSTIRDDRENSVMLKRTNRRVADINRKEIPLKESSESLTGITNAASQ
jgi:hypothetical protein